MARSDEARAGRRIGTARWSLLGTALLLAVVGLATVHSASSELGQSLLGRQTVWLALGLVVALTVMTIDYHTLVTFAGPLYGIGVVLLVVVLLVGEEGGGARSWLAFGPFRFQPSELVKLATAVLLARILARGGDEVVSGRVLLIALGVVAVPMLLIAIEPDLGGATMLVPMLGGMLLVAGVPKRLVITAAVGVLVVGGVVWTFGMKEYQRDRIATFFSPEADPLGAGYQLRQSKIAVGSGRVSGKGYMQGTQSQLRFLPARHTDFVFAVLAEEWGFLGVAAVFGLYWLFVVDGTAIATRARDREGILLAVGLLSTFLFHVVFNTAMMVGLVPVTGVPLPFLSYGGSFMLLNFATVGLLLGIDYRRYVNR